jgi:hypothetical protein
MVERMARRAQQFPAEHRAMLETMTHYLLYWSTMPLSNPPLPYSWMRSNRRRDMNQSSLDLGRPYGPLRSLPSQQAGPHLTFPEQLVLGLLSILQCLPLQCASLLINRGAHLFGETCRWMSLILSVSLAILLIAMA